MKYVFVSYSYLSDLNSPQNWLNRIGGYAGVMESLCKNNNTVISIQQIDYKGYFLNNGVHYHFVQFDKKRNYFPFSLHRFIKNLLPDVVFIHGLHQPLQVMQLRMMLPNTTKIIVQHHAEKPFKGIKKYIQLLASFSINAYLFASKDLGLSWVQNGNIASVKKIREVMEVSSNFYPINKIDAKLQLGITDPILFLWVGRLNQNKDPLTVVRAFLAYSEINKEAMLYMIYHTADLLIELNKIIQAHPNKNSIKLIGKVKHADLLYWYNSVDFFIAGSHYEGSGTALSEAMSCGCIPIVTDIFSFRMMTNNGNCGLLYEPDNEWELFKALRSIESINLNEESKKCLAYFNERLSFTAIATEIEKIATSLF